MKIDLDGLVKGLAIALLLFISGKVWQAVEISKENQLRIEYLRSDVEALWNDQNKRGWKE